MVSPEKVVPLFQKRSKKEEEAWLASAKITDSLFNMVVGRSSEARRWHDFQETAVRQAKDHLEDAEAALRSLETPAKTPTGTTDDDMSTPTREEFDARLREIATQGENRALRTDNKIDEVLRRLEARDAVQEERLKNLTDKLQTVASDTAATRDSVGSLKTTIITTTIATGLAVTALIYTLNTSLFTAFESGKTTATALSDASNKLTQVTERLDAMSKQPPEPTAPAATTAPSPRKK